jgi:processing peptidase subunit alpha
MVHDPPSWLPEILHELAYGPEGLGLSHLCPPSNLEHIGREQLHNFVKTYYVGPRVVVAAAGVEHDSFVKLCAKHFDSLPATDGGKPLHVPSVYKGYPTACLGPPFGRCSPLSLGHTTAERTWSS